MVTESLRQLENSKHKTFRILLSYINSLGYYTIGKLKFYFDFIGSISSDLELINT